VSIPAVWLLACLKLDHAEATPCWSAVPPDITAMDVGTLTAPAGYAGWKKAVERTRNWVDVG
jgi:hypothetical protein